MAISFKGAHFPTEIILMGVRWSVLDHKFSQTPPDLVVKLQPIDIIGVIVPFVLRPHVVY